MKFLQLTILILGLFIFAGNAQTITDRSEKSVLSGTVYDEYGAVIPQTKVSFTNADGKIFDTVTNEVGVFSIELNEGKYKIEFNKEGFAPYKIENYKVSFKTKMSLDISLDVGAMIDPIPVPAIKKKLIKRKN